MEFIKMQPQPIIHLISKEVIAEEWLCRPKNMSVDEYFNETDPYLLWKKEETCIKTGLTYTSHKKRMFNLTMSSIPYFLVSNLTWKGGIEIVEWGPKLNFDHPTLSSLVRCIQERELEVWVDDLTFDAWQGVWCNIPVNGYKLIAEELISNPNLLDILLKQGKPIIVEKIDTVVKRDWFVEKGILFGQGYLFSAM